MALSITADALNFAMGINQAKYIPQNEIKQKMYRITGELNRVRSLREVIDRLNDGSQAHRYVDKNIDNAQTQLLKALLKLNTLERAERGHRVLSGARMATVDQLMDDKGIEAFKLYLKRSLQQINLAEEDNADILSMIQAVPLEDRKSVV